MALIECPECRKSISELAEKCPNCGYPISEKMKNADMIQKDYNNIAPIYLFSYNNEYVNLECGNCGKVYSYNKKILCEQDEQSCEAYNIIKCIYCGNEYPPRTKIYKKTPTENKSTNNYETQIINTNKNSNSHVGVWVSVIIAIFLLMSCVAGSTKPDSHDGKCDICGKPAFRYSLGDGAEYCKTHYEKAAEWYMNKNK